jgi:hypothetical protein
MWHHILPRPGLVLSSAHVVRALDLYGPRFECGGCGAKMFVRYESKLCPRCYNGQRSEHAHEVVSEVLGDLAHFDAEEPTER